MTPMANGTMALVLSEMFGALIAGFAGLGVAAWDAGAFAVDSLWVAAGLVGADSAANLFPHLGQKATLSGIFSPHLGQNMVFPFVGNVIEPKINFGPVVMLRNIVRDGVGILDAIELKAEKGFPMSFFDDLQNSINRGVAGANRTGNTIKLKAQLNEAMKRRQTLAAQLGASLYEATKDDPVLRAGREAIYDGIANIDAERAGYQAEIDRIEAEAQAAQAAAVRYTCPFCGSSVAASDLFCSGCGKPMTEIEAAITKQRTSGIATAAASDASSSATCPQCGAPVNEGDMFCMSCGAKLESAPEPEPEPVVVPEPVVAPEPVVVPDPEPVAVPEPAAAPESAAVPDPEPEPEPIVASAPKSEPIVAPAPVFEPEPVSAPEPEPAAAPAPAFVPEFVPAAVSAQAPAPASESAVSLPSNMCPTCGATNDPEDKFCMHCGTKLR